MSGSLVFSRGKKSLLMTARMPLTFREAIFIREDYESLKKVTKDFKELRRKVKCKKRLQIQEVVGES